MADYDGGQFFLDRFEYSVAYGAVQLLSRISGPLSSGKSVAILLASFAVSFLDANKSTPGFTLVAQLYIANYITQNLPISDDSQTGPILMARIALYVCLVSLLTGLIYTTAERYKQLNAFVGGLSPYAILYTAGKCIARLERPYDALLSVILSLMYSFVRLWHRTSIPNLGGGIFCRFWVNLDFLGDRLTALAFARYVKLICGNSVIPICAIYSLTLFLLQHKSIEDIAALKSFGSLTVVLLTQKIYQTIALKSVSFTLFAVCALIFKLLKMPQHWLGQVAWVGLCLSIVQFIERFIATQSPSVSGSLAIYTIVFVALARLYPRHKTTTTSDTFNHVLAHATAPGGVPNDG